MQNKRKNNQKKSANMNETTLKNILNEVFVDTQIKNQLNLSFVRFCALDEGVIKSILKSNSFTIQESTLMNVLFSSTNTRVLNESTVKKLDFIVETIHRNKDWIMLTEGPFDKIKTGIKSIGSEISSSVSNAISGAWDKVKAVWSKFKDLVTQTADAVKEGLTKLLNAVKTSAIDSGGALTAKIITTYAGDLSGENKTLEQAIKLGAKLDTPEKAKGLVAEIKNLKASEAHIRTTVKSKWVDSPFWKEKMIAGDASPEPSPVKESTNKDYKIIKNLIEERNVFLSDNHIISELLSLSKNRKINEAFDLIDKALKSKLLVKIIEWCTKILNFLFKPLEKLMGYVAELMSEKGLATFSKIVAATGGPGTFVFVILTILVGAILKEVLASLSNTFIPTPAEIASQFIPGFGQLLLIGKPLIEGAKTLVAVYGFAILISKFLVDMENGLKGGAKSETGEEGGDEGGGTEPEPQNAGYTPRGTFKIQEGNLIFVK